MSYEMTPQSARVKRAVSAGQATRRGLNEGWVNVERSTLDRIDRYTTETALAFPGGWLEVRQYSWSQPIESVWTTDRNCYLLNLSLMGATEGARAKVHTVNDHETDALGRMFLVPPGQTVRCGSLQGKVRSIRCALDATLVASFLGDREDRRLDSAEMHQLLDLQGGEIEWLLRRMYREVRSPDFATLTMIETIAKQLSGEIVRKLKPRCSDTGFHVGGLAPWRMRLIDKRLRADLPTPDLDELAQLCDMTVRHLARAFRTETGQTIGKHIEVAMVERASHMLRAGDPVREVATRLGYATSGGFTAAYRRATGLLPREVRAAPGSPAHRESLVLN